MLDRVRRTIKEDRLFQNGDRILAGVSGGADSVALLYVLHELAEEEGWELHVAHVEHGLRGEESIEDARFVEDLCCKLNLPFHLGQPHVKAFAEEKNVPTQVAARELRYQFFEETAQSIGANKLALAHHADDQAETILMRILRGTSVSGLAGIPLRRQMNELELVRPFLYIGREEIEEYCRVANIPYRTDSSNALTEYFRNKIRLQLIPLLQSQYNGNIKRALLQLGKIAADEDRYLEEQTEVLLQQAMLEKNDKKMTLQTCRLLDAPVALQRRTITLILYYLCGHTKEWEAKHIEQILRLAQHSNPSARIDLPDGIQAWREYDLLHIGKKMGYSSPAEEIRAELPVPHLLEETVSVPHFFELSEFPIRGSLELVKGSVSPSNPWEAVFDYDDIKGRKFVIRSRRHGDVFRPQGMAGTKKIKEILMEARVPREQRDHWPLWVLENQIVWVTGIRRGSLAPVRPETRVTLRISVDRNGSEVT
ncbi:tRNA lysidine(34) synthetase TilS [Effusibacillus consociatus]|uniref:tRNA(Ile)-lysidine synthase n=1 Tax=Effusibacillus consociatus TaxID=1117041 RepID=A0ABV9Q199_9BACL